MSNYKKPIKLHIDRYMDRNSGWIVGTYADGSTICFGNFKTDRGAKTILTKIAKLFDLTKSKDGMTAS